MRSRRAVHSAFYLVLRLPLWQVRLEEASDEGMNHGRDDQAERALGAHLSQHLIQAPF